MKFLFTNIYSNLLFIQEKSPPGPPGGALDSAVTDINFNCDALRQSENAKRPIPHPHTKTFYI